MYLFSNFHDTKFYIINELRFFSEYGVATQRMCLQRGPSDSEDRCAYTKWQYRRVLMCFCRGDLCNDSTKSLPNNAVQLSIFSVLLLFYRLTNYM